MASKSSDFNRFLEANYPDDWLRFSSQDVKDDVVFSIISRYEKKYEIWKRIPEWIKSFYGDRLPNELFDGNEPFDRFIEDVEKRLLGGLEYDYTKLNAHIYRTIMSDEKARLRVSRHMEKGGYTFENSCKLSYEEMYREKISKDKTISDEERRKRHTESWGRTAKIIVEDWKENQVDKWVFHLAKEYDREKTRARRAREENDEKKAIEHNIKAAKRKMEFDIYIKKIKDQKIKDSYVKLMNNIVEKHRKEEEEAKKPVNEQVKNFLDEPKNKEVVAGLRGNQELKNILR